MRAVPARPHPPASARYPAAFDLRTHPPLLVVGDRINAQGSRRVKRSLLEENYDAILDVAREQADAGAHVLDVCVALPERSDEAERMATVVQLLSSRLELPLMLDSIEPAVIARGLEHLPGRGIVNSISLKGGRAKLDAMLPLVQRHGTAVVALCIDERGMAVTRQRKLEIAWRIHDIAVHEYGLPGEALIFDLLVFTRATGDPVWAESVPETLEAIRLVKEAMPGVLTVLGVSNISYGLAAPARAILNSVHLHHAVQAGLDVALVNPVEITPYYEIPPEARERADDLLFNRREDALARYVAHFGK